MLVEKYVDDVLVYVKIMLIEDLLKDGVLIKIVYFGINYKDGLVGKVGGNIVREYLLILGIDVVGMVVFFNDLCFVEGDEVIVISYEFGVLCDGGLS